jgi:hypothetical protein
VDEYEDVMLANYLGNRKVTVHSNERAAFRATADCGFESHQHQLKVVEAAVTTYRRKENKIVVLKRFERKTS